MFNIAIFGRPNVGKSTLFNALVGKRKAIVSNVSGVTVDRNYGFVKLNDIFFNLIDTAGIVNEGKRRWLHGSNFEGSRGCWFGFCNWFFLRNITTWHWIKFYFKKKKKR